MTFRYIPVIGLEIHVQLSTATKIFCPCSTDYIGAEPNTNVCPVCLGLPGSLPVLNKKAVELGVRAGLALSCTIRNHTVFHRKNYFYPDLPKAYQISQYDLPLAEGGEIYIPGDDGRPRQVRMKVKVAGITDEQVVAYTWGDNEVSWTLVSSSQQKAQDGKYTLVPKGDETLVKFELLADPNVPLPGFVLKRAVKGTIDSATKALRERVLKVKKDA